MAGDWIKMRGGLFSSPKLIAMARELHNDEFFREWLTPGGGETRHVVSDHALRCVTGALLCVTWSWSREYGKMLPNGDCFLCHIRLGDVDSIAGAPGVGKAMQSVGWAEYDEELGGVILPKFFAEHNVPLTGAEKQRAYRERKKAGLVTNSDETRDQVVTSALPQESNKPVTREEKSREEKNTENNTCVSAKHDSDSSTPRQRNEYPEDFEVFWSHYPRVRRVNKGDALKAWKQALRYTTAEVLISSAVEYAASRLGLSDYSKMPATWLRDRSWEDDRESWNREGKNGNGREPKLRGLEGGTRVADSL